MYCHYAGHNCICRFFNQFKHSLKFVHAETSNKGAYYIDGTLQVWKDDLDTSNTLAELLDTTCLEYAFPPCHCCNDKKVIVLLRLSNNCAIILAEFALLWCFPPWRSSEIIHKQEKRIHIQAADNCGIPCVFCSASMAARKSRGSLGAITCQETSVRRADGQCCTQRSYQTEKWKLLILHIIERVLKWDFLQRNCFCNLWMRSAFHSITYPNCFAISQAL